MRILPLARGNTRERGSRGSRLLRRPSEVRQTRVNTRYSDPRRSDVVPRCGPATPVTLRFPCFAKDLPGRQCPGVRCMQLTPGVAFAACGSPMALALRALRCTLLGFAASRPARPVCRRSLHCDSPSAAVLKLFPRFRSRRPRCGDALDAARRGGSARADAVSAWRIWAGDRRWRGRRRASGTW